MRRVWGGSLCAFVMGFFLGHSWSCIKQMGLGVANW